MSFFYLSTSTWRVLGLSVAASYTGLGLFEVVFPRRAALEFFALPSVPAATAGVRQEDEERSEAVRFMVPLLGVRDLSIAAALWTFAYQGKWREVGTVILAGTILCAADCWVVWRRVGPRLGAQFTGGAVGWTVIGAVLSWS
ncbi:hypothetical protein B0T14DRAFT_193934 [Immersiella caudata]|uniref:Uncharacterized protein n=1 Tax=Immersiella caudata TaxID=314043 RepID=A0AA40C3N5_9PEZI|nr:hypothetical protein B0T14DRAFT_193934 [Immersiella caudata]